MGPHRPFRYRPVSVEAGLREERRPRYKDRLADQRRQGPDVGRDVARAVIAEPRVVLADEPTGSLHWSQGQAIMELLRKLHEGGTTIIQVSHDERVAAYGQRIIELNDGWIA